MCFLLRFYLLMYSLLFAFNNLEKSNAVECLHFLLVKRELANVDNCETRLERQLML